MRNPQVNGLAGAKTLQLRHPKWTERMLLPREPNTPFIEEYTLNHVRGPGIFQGIFLDESILGSPGMQLCPRIQNSKQNASKLRTMRLTFVG